MTTAAPSNEPERMLGLPPLAAWATVLDRLEIDLLDDGELARLVWGLRALGATIDGAIVRAGMRADELAAGGSCPPAPDLLTGCGQVRASTARREAARAAVAARSPILGRLMGSGRWGPDHLDALTRQLDSLDEPHLARVCADDLMACGADLPADTFSRSLRRLVEATAGDSDDDDPQARARASSTVRYRFDHRSGMGHLSAQLDPERFEAVVGAIEGQSATLANARGDGDEPVEKGPALAADALVDLICRPGRGGVSRAAVTVVVDDRTLRSGRHDGTIAETGDGHPLSDGVLGRLCCDAVLQRVVLDERGVPINVGRSRRTASPAQWSALRSIYSSCAWAGCDRSLRWCQAHHVTFWDHGGPTDLDNLVPLCSHHHHLVHDRRWRIDLLDDRALRIVRPDGRLHTITPPPTRRPPPTAGPVATQPANLAA